MPHAHAALCSLLKILACILGWFSALCSLLAFLSVVAALPFGRSFHAQDLANCACAELALEYGLRRRRGPQGETRSIKDAGLLSPSISCCFCSPSLSLTATGHRCCGAGQGFRAVRRPHVLPGEGEQSSSIHQASSSSCMEIDCRQSFLCWLQIPGLEMIYSARRQHSKHTGS
mgnify:CR=1 FL=1